MKVLVTGSQGFTGKYLCEELEKCGHAAVGLAADLTDGAAVADEVHDIKPEAVAHLAGISFVAHANASQIYNVNLLGTCNLLDALIRHAAAVRHVLLASSAYVCGNKNEGTLFATSPLEPNNDYAVSKLAMEKMAELRMDRLPILIVRPYNYTGVGQEDKFVIPKIISHFRDRKGRISLGNIDVYREFGDVRRVAKIYRKLMESEIAKEAISICTGAAYSLRDVLSLCEEISGHRLEVEVNQDLVRKDEVKILVGNRGRLDSLIGQEEDVSLRDTLSWMLHA